jgi:hypothetical protein
LSFGVGSDTIVVACPLRLKADMHQKLFDYQGRALQCPDRHSSGKVAD